MSFFEDWIASHPSPVKLSDAPRKSTRLYAAPSAAAGMTEDDYVACLVDGDMAACARLGIGDSDGGGGGGGGVSYRPQTAEEAAALQAQAELDRARAAGLPGLTAAETGWLGAQTKGMPGLWGSQSELARAQAAGLPARTAAETALYGAQAKDIPLARELARRMGLAEIGAAQAERAANPRRIFEALYTQARLKPTEMAKSLQTKMNIPGFKEGKAVAGPVLARVGKDDDEYALLAPGSVVAPKPTGEQPTVPNAISAIIHQMREGGVVSQPKAKKILKHGEVRGGALTEKQRGLFGLIAGGGTPTKLKKAQAGLSVWGPEYGLPQDVSNEMERLRKQATTTVLGATRKATAGTSLFDPMGAGGRFEPGQAKYLRGLNLRHLRKLSPTQQEALFSTLSAGEIDPEDYVESMQRQFAGFNPVQAGTRARFAGILGR